MRCLTQKRYDVKTVAVCTQDESAVHIFGICYYYCTTPQWKRSSGRLNWANTNFI